MVRTIVIITPVLVILGFIGYTEICWGIGPHDQPIKFSHRLHAGVREIDCKYCHRGTEKGYHAGVPSVQDCWNCHNGLVKEGSNGAPVIERPEVQKLLNDYVANQRDIRWFKEFDLPEHVKFQHRAHINAGLDCKNCHGDVATMDAPGIVRSVPTAGIRTFGKPTMGWCVDCHRGNTLPGFQAPTDCTTCHY